MALARETNSELVKPLEGAIIRRFTAGSTIEAGEAVAMASDGAIDPADASAITLAMALGVALGPNDYVAGDRVDVCVFGPVQCLTGATIGDVVYVTDTAGEPSHTAGTKTAILGMPESATVLFVSPQWISQS
jgi:hypothetical protein